MDTLPGRRAILALGSFTGLTALAGGLALLAARRGSATFPLEALRYTPFTDFLWPGLLLAGVVGGASLAAVALALRRSQWALDVTLLAGGALTVWILAEAALFRGVHWLQVLYGALGLALLAVGIRSALRAGVPRTRWTVWVTAAETAGFLAPVAAGWWTTRSGWEGWGQVAVLAAAGALEGLALGRGQAQALPVPVHRGRFAALTALGAATVWAAVMSVRLAASSKTLPGWAVAVIWACAAGVGLLALGGAQWLELRHHVKAAHRWVGWTALAWTVALPLSFVPGPFVDETTPWAAQLSLWACGGALMAYAMALITWQGARRLVAQPPARRQVQAGSGQGELVFQRTGAGL